MNLTQPCAARIYDTFLGGNHNFGADRAFADQAELVLPGINEAYRENRAFLRRTVDYLLSVGVRQFLDLGSGIPTIGHIHDVARRRTDNYRVLYVDNEPLTVAHSRPLLADDPRVDIIEADCRNPQEILGSPEALELLNMKEPIALFMLSLLHFLSGENTVDDLVAYYRSRLVPGSYLCVSHVTASAQPRHMGTLEKLYASTADPLVSRTPEHITRWFEHFQLVPPGLGFLAAWRPDPGVRTLPRYRLLYGGIGQKLTAPVPRTATV